MISATDFDLLLLQKNFFGREQTLKQLETYFESDALDWKKIVVLNAPGVGKTALAKKALSDFRRKKDVLGLYFDTSGWKGFIDSDDASDRLKSLFRRELTKELQQQHDWESSVHTEFLHSTGEESFSQYVPRVLSELDDKGFRVVMAFDEVHSLLGHGQQLCYGPAEYQRLKPHIQVFQDTGTVPEVIRNREKEIRRGFFQLLVVAIDHWKTLHSGLYILSGTRLRVLQYVSDSPTLGKIVPILLDPLDDQSMEKMIDGLKPSSDMTPKEKQAWEVFKHWTVRMADGIPRIVEWIFQLLQANWSYARFMADAEANIHELHAKLFEFMKTEFIEKRFQLLENISPLYKPVLSQLATHFLLHSSIDRESLDAIIEQVARESSHGLGAGSDPKNEPEESNGLMTNTPVLSHSHFVEAGVLVISSEKIQIRSPMIGEIIRERFFDTNAYKEVASMLTSVSGMILKTHPSVIGFAVEVLFAFRVIYSVKKQRLNNLVENYESRFVINTPKDVKSLPIDKLRHIIQNAPLVGQQLSPDTMYLLSREPGVDAIFLSGQAIVLTQIKFKQTNLTLRELRQLILPRLQLFTSRYEDLLNDKKIVHLLVLQEVPTEDVMEELTNLDFLVCAGPGLENLLGTKLFNELKRMKLG